MIYDEHCALCRRCRTWLETSSQLVTIGFVPASDLARIRQLGLDPRLVPVGDELVVVADNGAVWVGPDAFITCLWALADHRRLAGRLQSPMMRPVAKRAFHALSLGRGSISMVLGGEIPRDPCEDATCQPDSAHG